MALLVAMAKEGPVAEPLAGNFIACHGLRATSTESYALKNSQRDYSLC